MSGVQLPSAAALMAEARQRAGIDIVDEAAREPLERLVHALNTEGQLHEAGGSGMTARLVRILANRLRMQRDIAAHPEILGEPVTAPLFICGMARTGSTKTQKLLAASGDFNWLPYWKVLNPSLWTGDRAEPVQPRIDDVEAFARWFDAASPETAAGHAFETHEPEEESFILEHSLRTPTFLGWAPIPSYLDWLFTQDMTAQFIQLRDTLKYLQWQGLGDSTRSWVLKSPLYSGLEPLLLAVFPDAKLVMTHRHPDKTIASGLRLLELFYAPFTDAAVDVDGYVGGLAAMINGHLDARPTLPPDTFLDIHFDELVFDIPATVRRIYDFIGARLSPEALARMIAWDHANPQHKRGTHRYTMAQYGLDDAGIARSFARYDAFLAQCFPGR